MKELWFKAEKLNPEDFKSTEMEYKKMEDIDKDKGSQSFKNRYIDILRYDTKWDY